MGAPPHRVESEHGGPTAGPEPDGEQRIPQPLAEADKGGGTRMAVAVVAVALAIIVLVVLL